MASVIVVGLSLCDNGQFQMTSQNKKHYNDLKEIFSLKNYDKYKEKFLAYNKGIKIPVIVSHISAVMIRNEDKKYVPNDEEFNDRQFASRIEEIGKWLAFMYVAQQGVFPYEELNGLQSYFETLQSNKALQKLSLKDRCTSITNSLVFLRQYSPESLVNSELIIMDGEKHNFVLQCRMQDNLGMFMIMKNGLVSGIFTDSTILVKMKDEYKYLERHSQVPKAFTEESINLMIEKKVKIIRDVEGRFMKVMRKTPEVVIETETAYKTSFVRQCKKKSEYKYFQFADGTMHVLFEDSQLSYYVNPHELQISIIQNGAVLADCPIDNKMIKEHDEHVNEHLDIVEFLLRSMISKRDAK